jgi:hypothetical protein
VVRQQDAGGHTKNTLVQHRVIVLRVPVNGMCIAIRTWKQQSLLYRRFIALVYRVDSSSIINSILNIQDTVGNRTFSKDV